MPKPVILFGGPSPEHDISVSTGLQASHTIGDVHAVYWAKNGRFHLVEPDAEPREFADGVPRKARELVFVAEPGQGFVVKKRPVDASVVVNCCHGGPGEDGTIQAALDLAGYRYTGPGVAGSALGMDKLAFSASVAAAGMPALPRLLLQPGVVPPFEPPYIVKPRFGGSSIGIEVVADLDTAIALLGNPHMSQGAVVEPFLVDCRDLQVAVKTHPAFETSAIEEPMRASGGLYSYEQKYLAWGEGGAVGRELPACMPSSQEADLRRMARLVSDLVGVRSVARIDFLEREGELWVNEVNTIPGSLAAYLWIDPPMTRAALLEDFIAEAIRSPARHFPVTGADGSALRNAGSIASKLG